jgi:hypothetical protein
MSEQDDMMDETEESSDLQHSLATNESAEYVYETEKPSRDKSVLGALLLLTLAGGAIWFMYKRTGPANALAADPNVTTARQTIDNFLGAGQQNLANMRQMLTDTEQVVQKFLSYPAMTQVPLSDLRINPFRHHVTKPEISQPASDAAEKRRREEERARVLREVQALNLQSIMHSDARKACMINNRLFREGDKVDSFTLEQITATGVIVRSGPYRFEIRINR